MTVPAWIDTGLAQDHLGGVGAAASLDTSPYLAAAAAYLRRRRPDLIEILDSPLTGPGVVDADVQLGVVMLAARLISRRGTTLGLATLGDAGVGMIARTDPDIARLLGVGVSPGCV